MDKMREEIAIIIHEGFMSDVKAGAMADDVLSLLAPVFEKAEKYDELFPLVNDIATVSYRQVNGDRGPLTTAEIWNWQADAERVLYGHVGAYKGEVKDEN